MCSLACPSVFIFWTDRERNPYLDARRSCVSDCVLRGRRLAVIISFIKLYQLYKVLIYLCKVITNTLIEKIVWVSIKERWTVSKWKICGTTTRSSTTSRSSTLSVILWCINLWHNSLKSDLALFHKTQTSCRYSREERTVKIP